MTSSLATILHRFSIQGHQQYDGESISQLDHALQCATLAEAAHCSPKMITACLLHDMGHLLPDVKGTVVGGRVEGKGEGEGEGGDRHEHRAIPWLQGLFGLAVTEPIRLHVAAKRYLCATNPTYWASLSPASKHSLDLQGGVFSQDAAQRFIRQPYAKEAVQLRRWDDRAKIPHLKTPDLDYFLPIIERCLLDNL